MVVREDFSVAAMVSIQDLKKGAAIHVIGICGVAMAPLALSLSRAGFKISGSDKEFYEPMGGLLKSQPSITLFTGYDAGNIPPQCDAVVIGNAVSVGNPEVEAVFNRKIPYTIFPKLLFDLGIYGKTSIVVCGTHGKTTTTALGAHTLLSTGMNPSYFVGGAVHGFEQSLVIGAGAYSIVEGDEYDSSFFAKVPKFSFYGADVMILTSVEFDHADIYQDAQHVENVFLKGVDAAKTCVIACIDDAGVARVIGRASQKNVVTYGESPSAQYRLLSVDDRGGAQHVVAMTPRGEIHFELSIPGKYNALNALSLVAAFEAAGMKATEFLKHFSSFKGVRRRQEEHKAKNGLLVIEDFAHHPTAVRETLSGLKKRYAGKNLWAVFEPRSNTSRRVVFKEAYERAFDDASKAILCEVTARAIDQGIELIKVEDMVSGIKARGVDAIMCTDAVQIANYVAKHANPKNDVVVVMSNGSFGGLVGKLVG